MIETLASLVAAAALVGSPAVPVATPPSARARAASGETIEAKATLASLAANQARAFVSRELGGAAFEAAVGFDAQGASWFKLRQGSWSAAFSEDALKAGATAALPSGPASLKLAKGVLTMTDAAGAVATLSERELTDALYAAATRIPLGPIAYAALWEDGSSAPAALDLLRRDGEGHYFVTYRTPQEMRSGNQWIMATGGRIYGMKVSGLELVFVSKPLPPVPARR